MKELPDKSRLQRMDKAEKSDFKYEVLYFASRLGIKQAANKYGVATCQVKKWQEEYVSDALPVLKENTTANKIKIVVSSNNQNKIREIKDVFEGLNCEVLSYFDILKKRVEVVEDGNTFEENAVKKLINLPDPESYICLADDSGLKIESLNGAPGINSARYAGAKATKKQLCEKILLEMTDKKNRAACFITVIALRFPDTTIKIVTGQIEGEITKEMRGSNGFGYDSIFKPDGYGVTLAEMSAEHKNKISHRYKALMEADHEIVKFIKNSLVDNEPLTDA
ncbi:MAG: RdgB/HAM1 family non-canonical purine NTP pyrophosphatase [bacterium]|nr:RdgB/HAM1 family non-canonical purine NTP pyrophosphatase [bacterium]